MGTGYHGGFGHTKGAERHEEYSLKNQTTIENNVKTMHSEFPLINGKFGVKGRNCQVIYCGKVIESSQEFYNLISNGGIESKLNNGHGVKSVLGDGTIIVYRQVTSTADSPAVEIAKSSSNRVRNQKIHFEEVIK